MQNVKVLNVSLSSEYTRNEFRTPQNTFRVPARLAAGTLQIRWEHLPDPLGYPQTHSRYPQTTLRVPQNAPKLVLATKIGEKTCKKLSFRPQPGGTLQTRC